MNKQIFREVFFNIQDAENWLEHHLEDYKDWFIEEAWVKYINEAWSAALIVRDKQLEIDFDE